MNMLSVRETLEIIGRSARRLPANLVDLKQACGHILAQPISLDADAPPFDKALLDGYAVQAPEAHPGAILKILGRVDAGSAANFLVRPNTCVAINTGAPMPAGANAVVMVENTRRPQPAPASLADQNVRNENAPPADGLGTVEILATAAPGAGVGLRGQDARRGDTILLAGTRLGAAQMAVAASAGAANVSVFPKTKIAVLSTGDELVAVEDVPGPGQIRNSNSIMLAGLVRAAECELVNLGHARDDGGEILGRLERGLAEADITVVTGGMSMGTRDLVPGILVELGVEILVQKVSIKPGKPFVFGIKQNAGRRRYVVGLPGNPVSALVCFLRFVRPLVAALEGAEFAPRELEKVPCLADLPANGEREFYQPGVMRGHAVTPLEWKGSADIFTLARADVLIVHEPMAGARAAGSLVRVLPL